MTGDSRASTTSTYEPSSINKVFHVQQDGVVQILNLCKRTLFFLKLHNSYANRCCTRYLVLQSRCKTSWQ